MVLCTIRVERNSVGETEWHFLYAQHCICGMLQRVGEIDPWWFFLFSHERILMYFVEFKAHVYLKVLKVLYLTKTLKSGGIDSQNNKACIIQFCVCWQLSTLIVYMWKHFWIDFRIFSLDTNFRVWWNIRKLTFEHMTKYKSGFYRFEKHWVNFKTKKKSREKIHDCRESH